MILRFSREVGIALLVPRYEGVVLVGRWSMVHEAIVFGRVGSEAFTAFAVFIVLQTVSDTSHVQTNIKDSARHYRQTLDSKRTDAIKYQERVVEIKGVV